MAALISARLQASAITLDATYSHSVNGATTIRVELEQDTDEALDAELPRHQVHALVADLEGTTSLGRSLTISSVVYKIREISTRGDGWAILGLESTA